MPEHYEATGDALCGNVMLHARGASSIFAQTYNLAGAEKIAAALNDHQGAVEAARALAQWTQHAPACARAKTTANSCTCGLQEAWLAIDSSAGGR